MKAYTFYAATDERGVGVQNPHDAEGVGDTIEHLTGKRPWEHENDPIELEVHCSSPREAKAVVAYLRKYYEEHREPLEF